MVKPAVSGSGRSRGKQTRVLLLTLPLRAEAADAETVGGLPASAFYALGTPTSRVDGNVAKGQLCQHT